ncbi:hypothetical protein [Arcobacter sp.]|uniref:hypothetical protein n=1 Tax=Arcobacter sp. TaxID=1872629 RepID=UPI003C744FED
MKLVKNEKYVSVEEDYIAYEVVEVGDTKYICINSIYLNLETFHHIQYVTIEEHPEYFIGG